MERPERAERAEVVSLEIIFRNGSTVAGSFRSPSSRIAVWRCQLLMGEQRDAAPGLRRG
jgi:hypothetical protein